MDTYQDLVRLPENLERLLDQFELEVKTYDKWSEIAMVVTPVGVLMSIFLPLVLLQSVGHINPYLAISTGISLYWMISGICATLVLSRLVIIYLDYKKHEISKVKYKPVAGVCMCDLSMFRSQIHKMEKARTIGDRLRHAKLACFYKQQMGWQ